MMGMEFVQKKRNNKPTSYLAQSYLTLGRVGAKIVVWARTFLDVAGALRTIR